MLNKLLAKLNGSALDVDALIAALVDLGRERDTAQSELGELQVRRHQALLDDASDSTLDKLERDIARKETAVEKLDLAEPGLRDRLATAKVEARQRQWRALRDAYLVAAGEFLTAARDVAEKHAALIAIVGEAQRAGFAAEVAATMPATPNANGYAIAAPELLDIFERAIAPPQPRPAQATAAAKREKTDRAVWKPGSEDWTPLPRGMSLQHAITSAISPRDSLGLMTAQRALDDVTPLGPSEARVKVLRSGFSPADDRPQCCHGQLIRMALDTAQRAAGTGAVEIIEKYVPTAAASTDKPIEGDSQNV